MVEKLLYVAQERALAARVEAEHEEKEALRAQNTEQVELLLLLLYMYTPLRAHVH